MTYPKLPGLTWDGTIYENDEMGTLEALLPTGGYPTAHAPAMAELPDGSLLCCWFAGTYRVLHSAKGQNGLDRTGEYFRGSAAQRAESLPFLWP